MDDDDYELAPHKQLEELRHEIDILKRNPLGDSKGGRDLLSAVERLNQSIGTLIDLFKLAADDLKKEHEAKPPELKPIIDRLEELERQNRTIAEGMVALSDMVKQNSEKPVEAMPPPTFSPPPQPTYSPPPPLSPPSYNPPSNYPMFEAQDNPQPLSPPPAPFDMPPPPPSYAARRSLFGRK